MMRHVTNIISISLNNAYNEFETFQDLYLQQYIQGDVEQTPGLGHIRTCICNSEYRGT